ncbi:MAG: four helix bundle protein [bacterium]
MAEGYCRRSINEYIQYLYIAAGSLGETLSRIISLQAADQITKDQFERIDILHYEVENKLLHLIESLEEKREKGEWITRVSDDFGEYFTK